MNNACPECGAVYAVAEKDIGRRIACKKCGTALVVAEDGLRRESEADPVPPRKDDTAERERARDRDDRDRDRERDEDDRGRRRDRDRDEDDDRERDRDRGRRARGPGAGEVFNKIKAIADIPTWIYGVGLFFTIYGFFGYFIDKAKENGRQGVYESEKTEFEAYKRGVNDPPGGNPSEGDQKRLQEREKEWTKKTEPSLKDDVDFAKAGTKRGQWWNVMFKLIGFFLLAFGSIGFLRADNPPLKRILGGVTIFLILLQVIGGGAGLHVDLGGGGGGPGRP